MQDHETEIARLREEIAAKAREMDRLVQEVAHWQAVAHEADKKSAAVRHGLESKLSEVEVHLAATLDSNHRWFVRSGELERQLEETLRSTSWRATAPLRSSRRAVDSLVKPLVKRPLMFVIRRLRNSPWLWTRASKAMKRHPGLSARLKALAVAQDGTVREPAAIKPPANGAQVVAGMSAYQRNIHSRLKREF